MCKIGLVLEGGAMRGIYTAGVLDYFMKKELYLPYVIGVSAGACQACSYISKQKGRSKHVGLDYVNDPRYLSYRNLLKEGSIFGFDFMFNDIANELIPFDYSAFDKSEQEFAIGVTNCITGEPEYFYKSENEYGKMFEVCQASSSMPLVAKESVIDGKAFMDGGISDSIPIKRAIEDGYHKNIIVLTRNEGYRKQRSKFSVNVAKLKYSNYKGLVKAMENRHENYNKTMDMIEELEKNRKVFVIRPTEPVTVKRIEKNRRKLFEFYKEGYMDAKNCYNKLESWMKSNI